MDHFFICLVSKFIKFDVDMQFIVEFFRFWWIWENFFRCLVEFNSGKNESFDGLIWKSRTLQATFRWFKLNVLIHFNLKKILSPSLAFHETHHESWRHSNKNLLWLNSQAYFLFLNFFQKKKLPKWKDIPLNAIE